VPGIGYLHGENPSLMQAIRTKPMADRPYNVLFLCTGNSARSILAERIMEGLRSKSWDEFAAPGAPPLDFVFTVCDNAAGEVCPYWPGQPMTAHWGMPDPAAVEGSEPQRWVAFRAAFNALENRIKIFTSLPLASIDRMKLQERLDAIGKTVPLAEPP
jgi:protein-tyrosine-phosphatase